MSKRGAVHLTILPREMAQRIASIAGYHSACAAALRELESWGEMADQFEIVRDPKNGVIALFEKKYLRPDA